MFKISGTKQGCCVTKITRGIFAECCKNGALCRMFQKWGSLQNVAEIAYLEIGFLATLTRGELAPLNPLVLQPLAQVQLNKF